MSAILNRVAGKAGQSAFRASTRAASSEAKKDGKDTVLQKGAKRDPELYVCPNPTERCKKAAERIPRFYLPS